MSNYSMPLYLYGRECDLNAEYVENICDSLGILHATVDCVECRYSKHVFLASIINQLKSKAKSPDATALSEGITVPSRSIRPITLIDKFKKIGEFFQKKIVINLVKVKSLDQRVFGATFLPFLLRIAEFVRPIFSNRPFDPISQQTGSNIHLNIIEETAWEELEPLFPSHAPLAIFLQSPTDEQMVELIYKKNIFIDKNSIPPHLTHESIKTHYRDCCSHTISLLRISYPTFGELLRLVRILFSKYLEPLFEPLPEDIDVVGFLFTKFQVYLTQMRKSESIYELCNFSGDTTATSQLFRFNFPLFSKYILISSWLASYHPNFNDAATKKRKGHSIKEFIAKTDDRNISTPRSFTITNLVLIVDSLLKHTKNSMETEKNQKSKFFVWSKHCRTQTEVFRQMCTLIQLGLIVKVSAGTQIEHSKIKFQCRMDQNFVNSIANSVDLELWGYY